MHRAIPGLNVLTWDGLLPLPTSDQQFEVSPAQLQEGHLHGKMHVNILLQDGALIPWDEGPSRLLPTRLRSAYERLLSGLHRNPILCTDRQLDCTVFLESNIPERGTFVWEFCVPRSELVNRWYRSHTLDPPRRVFELVHQTILPVAPIPLPTTGEISRVLTRSTTTKGVTQRIRIGKPTTHLQFALQFRWRDEVELFDTSTSHLRFLQLPLERHPHRRISQWISLFHVDLHLPSLWRNTNNFRIPQQLWDTLRAISAWNIWKARCKHHIEGTRSLSTSVIHLILARLKIYLRQEWQGYAHKIKLGQLNQTEALTRMTRSFGGSSEVWETHEEKLQIPPAPPRPP